MDWIFEHTAPAECRSHRSERMVPVNLELIRSVSFGSVTGLHFRVLR